MRPAVKHLATTPVMHPRERRQATGRGLVSIISAYFCHERGLHYILQGKAAS